jgi:predicted component of type VI protein secretion system
MTITLVAKGDRPLDGPSAEFDEQGGTIGRRTDCTLVLADEHRHVSRVHALVEFRSDYFCIVDKGSYLPATVNGMRVGRGQETPIFEGDELHIGPYAMRVTHVAAAWDMDATTVVSELLSRPGAEPAPAAELPEAAAEIAPESAAAEEPAVRTSDASPEGNTSKKRASRSRKRARRKEPPLESISDNPSQTHEPRQGMPLEESVARLLAADTEDASPGHPRGPVAVPAPGVEIAAADDGAGDRPGFSTFDLLADRLQIRGDLAYEPFLPTVWDEIAKGPGEHPPVAHPPEVPAEAAAVVEEASVADEAVAEVPAATDSTAFPAATQAAAEIAQDFSPEPLEASAADSEAAATVAEDIADAMAPAQEAAVVERVVRRRRQRGKREESSVVVAAGHAESPMTELPEIVLVLQPVAAAETDATGRTDDYVIPIRRRNRRPQSAAR